MAYQSEKSKSSLPPSMKEARKELQNISDVFAPETEGIKYTDSKRKLLPYIISMIQSTNAKSVLDGFSGTTRVSQALAKQGYRVIANDIAIWSRMFSECYLLNKYPPSHYQGIIDHLNSLPPKKGWYTKHYGGKENGGVSVQEDGRKRPWQEHNTMKLGAIREEIEHLGLSSIEKSVVLTSLILALDSVDNTIGHHTLYLREWSPRSYRTMKMKVPKLIHPQCCQHEVYQEDIFSVLLRAHADLVYLDPPYGSSNDKMPSPRVRYSAYYHLWKTIILDDKPELFGRALRRQDSRDDYLPSFFESFRKNPLTGRFIAEEALERAMQLSNAKYVLLSYSTNGRIPIERLF